MTTGYLYAAALDRTALEQYISQMDEKSWCYLEHEYPLDGFEYAVEMVCLDSNIGLLNFAGGRIFNAETELRWQCSSNQYNVQILTESVNSDFSNFTQHKFQAGKKFAIYLWGQHINTLKKPLHYFQGAGNIWIEARIPRPLHYPVTDGEVKEHIKINAIHYYQNSLIRATRWCGREI